MALMTCSRLGQIKKNQAKLNQLREKHRELKSDYGLGSKDNTGMPTAGKVFDTSMSHLEEAVDAEQEYKALYYENEILKSEAREYIRQIPDVQLSIMLRLYFIKLLPLYEVADAVDISEKECEKIFRVHFNNVF